MDKIIKCKNCGSGDIKVFEDLGRCEHCGSAVEIILPKKQDLLTPLNSDLRARYNYVEIKNNLRIEDFKRNALIAIASCPDTPKDVFDSAFSKAKLEYNFYTIIETITHVHYTAQVGEDYRDSDDQWQTSWRYYNGHYIQKIQNTICLNSTPASYPIGNKILSLPSNDITSPQENVPVLMPTPSHIQQAVTKAEGSAKYNYTLDIPGDRHRFEKITSINTEIENVTIYITPIYTIKFNNGESIGKASCMGNNINSIVMTNVTNNEKKSALQENKKQQSKKLRPIKLLNLIALLAVIATAIYNFAITENKIFEIFCLSCGMLLLFLIIWIIATIKSKKTLKLLKEKLIKEHRQVKYHDLNNYCIHNNIATPSEEEITWAESLYK